MQCFLHFNQICPSWIFFHLSVCRWRTKVERGQQLCCYFDLFCRHSCLWKASALIFLWETDTCVIRLSSQLRVGVCGCVWVRVCVWVGVGVHVSVCWSFLMMPLYYWRSVVKSFCFSTNSGCTSLAHHELGPHAPKKTKCPSSAEIWTRACLVECGLATTYLVTIRALIW